MIQISCLILTDRGHRIRLKVIVNPQIQQPLISVHDLAKTTGPVTFHHNHATIYNHRDTCIGVAHWDNHLQAYSWHSPTKTPITTHAISARTTPHPTPRHRRPPKSVPPPSKPPPHPPIRRIISHPAPQTKPHISHFISTPQPGKHAPTPLTQNFYDWHLRLNHAPPRAIQNMARAGTLPALPAQLKRTPPRITCSACSYAKQRPAPHHPKTHQYDVGQYFSSDTCGPIHPASTHGNNHFLTFVDAATRHLSIFFLQNRRQVTTVLPSFISALHARGLSPHTLRTDNAMEFCSTIAK